MGFNFLTQFLEYTQDAESPTSFFRWSAIATLSAVMKDNVYWDVGFDRINPNIYVLLIAKSGTCRKGLPLKISESLLNKVGTVRMITGRATIQAVIKELNSTTTNANGVTHSGANALLYSEELSAFFHEGPETISVLTDLYDSHARWTNRTVGSGTQELENVCLSLLGASNEILLREVFTSQALYGGLLARTFIVMESRRRHKNSRMTVNFGNLTHLEGKLKAHLVRLAGIKGKVKFSAEAKAEYDEWYMSIDDDKYTSKSGVEARMHTGVIKLAICLAAAEEEFFRDLMVQKAHVSQAIDMTLELLPNYDMLTLAGSKSVVAEPMTIVVKTLLKTKGHRIARKTILRANFGDLDVESLDKAIVTMEQSGVVRTVSVNGEPGYQLTEKFISEITKVKEAPDGSAGSTSS